MPISKTLLQFLADHDGARHIVVDPGGIWNDPLHVADDLIQADPLLVAERLATRAFTSEDGWLERWRRRQAEVQRCLGDNKPLEAQVIETLARVLPPRALLFSANSLAIRQLDWYFSGRGEPMRILCNRGASGIDGNIATLLGMAESYPEPLVGLLGDLTLMHDIGALAEARECRAVILVMDNGGGAIFGHLPQAGLAEYEALFLTSRRVDLESASRAFGLGYTVTSPQTLAVDMALALQASCLHILHLKVDREESLQRHQALWRSFSE